VRNSWLTLRKNAVLARWGVFRDLEHADVFLETFLVTSWAEYLRQHERFTRGDSDVEAQVRRHVEGEPFGGAFRWSRCDLGDREHKQRRTTMTKKVI
jgi:Transmembrane secretion effector